MECPCALRLSREQEREDDGGDRKVAVDGTIQDEVLSRKWVDNAWSTWKSVDSWDLEEHR